MDKKILNKLAISLKGVFHKVGKENFKAQILEWIDKSEEEVKLNQFDSLATEKTFPKYASAIFDLLTPYDLETLALEFKHIEARFKAPLMPSHYEAVKPCTFVAEGEEAKAPELSAEEKAALIIEAQQKHKEMILAVVNAAVNNDVIDPSTTFLTEQFLATTGYPFNRDVVDRVKKDHLKGKLTSKQQRKVSVVILDKVRNAKLWEATERSAAIQRLQVEGVEQKVKVEDGVEIHYYSEDQIDNAKIDNPFCTLPVMKLDGHSRAYAWSKPGKEAGSWHLERPVSVAVSIDQDMTDEEIYSDVVEVFGGKKAVMSTNEIASAINKKTGLNFESEFVKQSWAEACRIIGKADKEESVRVEAQVALDFIDKMNIKAKYSARTNGEQLDVLKKGSITEREHKTVSKFDRFLCSGIRAAIVKTYEDCKRKNVSFEKYKEFWNDYFSPFIDAEKASSVEKVVELKAFITDCYVNNQKRVDNAVYNKGLECFDDFINPPRNIEELGEVVEEEQE